MVLRNKSRRTCLKVLSEIVMIYATLAEYLSPELAKPKLRRIPRITVHLTFLVLSLNWEVQRTLISLLLVEGWASQVLPSGVFHAFLMLGSCPSSWSRQCKA